MEKNLFQIAQAEKFTLELNRTPRKVQNTYHKITYHSLLSSPVNGDPPRKKRLKGYKDLWRVCVTENYRLIYRVDQKSSLVAVLFIDHRSKIYDRLGANIDGEPGIRIVANAEELLEREPTQSEIGHAIIENATKVEAREVSAPDNTLPEKLNSTILKSWGIESKYYKILEVVQTEGELLSLGSKVPSKSIEIVMNGLWPPDIEEIVQQPLQPPTPPQLAR